MIKQSFKKLNTKEIYQVLLFVLFKITNLAEYSTLSELIYVLDKDSFLRLCDYFGGRTIKIPTIDELEILVYCLVVYNAVNFEHKDYEQTLKELPIESHVLKKVRQMYSQVQEVMDEYDFSEQ